MPIILTAILTKYKMIYIILSKIQKLVYKNKADLSLRLTILKLMQKVFDDALIRYCVMLTTLNLKIDKLIKLKKIMRTNGD